MNRIEAVDECKRLGIYGPLSVEEFEQLPPAVQVLWRRSRSFQKQDELPTEIVDRVQQAARKLEKADALASENAG